MPENSSARLLSCNVGKPREILLGERTITTGIFKSPVLGRVPVKKLNLAGDQQADLAVHGGPDKAVYAYPSEHYSHWMAEMPGIEMPWGMFGENLTTEGVDEESVRIGDRLRIGSTLLQVTQPRTPCYKLALRFGRNDIIEKFWKSGRSGFYLAVLAEGDLQSGDHIELIPSPEPSVTLSELLQLYRRERSDKVTLARALNAPALPGNWKRALRER